MFLIINDPTQSKIRNKQIRILRFSPEEQVLRLEIAVDDPCVVDVFDGAEDSADY